MAYKIFQMTDIELLVLGITFCGPWTPCLVLIVKSDHRTVSVYFLSIFLGPFNHIKSSLLGSTSDSNLNKYSTINRLPRLTLNFSDSKNDKKSSSPPSSEKTIIAPKVKDRTHNVTEKVTQVGAFYSI